MPARQGGGGFIRPAFGRATFFFCLQRKCEVERAHTSGQTCSESARQVEKIEGKKEKKKKIEAVGNKARQAT
jgi:hypothetical protein